MIRGNKVQSIALFEFLCNVKRKGYLISTFGMPVFLMLYGAILSIPTYFSAKKDAETKIYGVVDRSGILGLEDDASVSQGQIPDEVRSILASTGQSEALDRALAMFGPSVFRPFDAEETAKAALQEGKLRLYFVLPEDFVATGEADVYYRGDTLKGSSDARDHLRALLLDRLLAGNVPDDVVERARKPITKWNRWTVDEDGTIEPRKIWGVVASLVIPLVFAALMIGSILGSAGYLIQGTAVEKENKVVEVLLSSANPQEIMTGKLLGLAGVGLLQVTVWFGMAMVGGLVFAATLAALGVEVPWVALAVAIPFFVAGYLFIGSLMLGTGSIGSNQRESQQWSMIWVFLTIAPLIMMMMLIEDPSNKLALVMTWIPFTAPLTVILRMTLEPGSIAWWEIGGSFLVLVASTYFAVQLSARLFRVGLLLTGARPKLRALLRQARLGT